MGLASFHMSAGTVRVKNRPAWNGRMGRGETGQAVGHVLSGWGGRWPLELVVAGAGSGGD